MTDDGAAELQKLKQRLEALGVKIKKGVGESSYSAATERPKTPYESKNSLDDALGRGRDEVGKLLERCSKVEAALNTHDADAQCQHASPETSAAPAERQLVVHPKKSSSPTPNKAGKAVGKKQRPAFVATVRQSNTNPTSGTPLSGLLADYKDAEARWNQEKAALRRELAAEKKRANKLELNFSKLNNMYEARLVDVKALRTALQNRDGQVQAANTRAKELEAALFQANEAAAEEMASIARERDDLKALLVATLKRLETVDRVVQRADMSNAVMEERVTQLEEERDKAVSAATSAQSRVESLLKSQRRVEWQNRLLDRISEVQMTHNRQKAAAIHELLDGPNGQGPSERSGASVDDEVTLAGDEDRTETLASDLDASSLSQYDMPQALRRALRQ